MKTRFLMGAVVALTGVTASAFAAPPLDCVENAKGQRWCMSSGVSFQRVPPKPDEYVLPTIHPATIKSTKIYQPVGQQVASIPLEKLLPIYQHQTRNSLGVHLQTEPFIGFIQEGAVVVK